MSEYPIPSIQRILVKVVPTSLQTSNSVVVVSTSTGDGSYRGPRPCLLHCLVRTPGLVCREDVEGVRPRRESLEFTN